MRKGIFCLQGPLHSLRNILRPRSFHHVCRAALGLVEPKLKEIPKMQNADLNIFYSRFAAFGGIVATNVWIGGGNFILIDYCNHTVFLTSYNYKLGSYRYS